MIFGINNNYGVIFEVISAWVGATGTEIKYSVKTLSSNNLAWAADNTSNWNVHVEGLQQYGIVSVLYYGFENVDSY